MASAFREDVIHGGVVLGGRGRAETRLVSEGSSRRRAGGGESGTESASESGGGRGCFGGSRELSVPDRVAQIFYSHGLFVSSHPWALICFAIAVVLLCCYPLLNLPLPGNVPQELLTPVTNYTVPGLLPPESGNYSNGAISGKNSGESPLLEGQHPWWYRGSPVSYIQQIVVKSAVTPWTDNLILTDAFRAPLAEVFDLLEIIRNYQNIIRGRTLSQLCLHVEAVKTKSAQRQSMVLPEYNCLLLSPANLWQQDKGTFQADPTLLSTIFNYQSIQKGKISLAELLFGMSMKDTGIKRYPFRTRQRVVQYAITIILKDYDPIYLDGLKHKLTSLHQPELGKGTNQNGTGQTVGDGNESVEVPINTLDEAESILHIYYPGHFNLHRMFPLLATYVALFLYIYFSVRKMELVRSKIGVALAAVSTVLASLCMSVGLCFFFGLALSLDGGDGKESARRDFYPYLVAVVGLENVLVLTRAAISTPPHLDTKIRIARALSREGWSITKNLLAEVTILTIGFFTFVPAIQEFCIFLVVGLLSDFFLQMMFFATVLAVDIRRLESLDAQHQRHHHHHAGYSSFAVENQMQHKGWPSADDESMSSLFWPSLCFGSGSRPQKQKLSRSRSHPRLLNGGYPADVVAPGSHSVNASPVVGGGKFASSTLVAKLPKRLKLLYFWARTRIIQRAFMFGMVVWISVIVYNTGIVDRLAYVDQSSGGHEEAVAPPRNDSGKVISPPYSAGPFVSPVAEPEGSRHDQIWRNQGSSLSHRHWPALLGMYNISVSGGYLSILPPIRIWIPVAPDVAFQLRHPEEKEGGGPAGQFQWQALAAALDPLDFSELESHGPTTPASSSSSSASSSTSSKSSSAPYVPSSPMELFLTSVLCIVSVAVVSYTMVVLYRCVCSRNYAEWRASWSGEDANGVNGQDAATQVVLEAVPLTLEGHPQEVECMASDPSGGAVASCCLAGQLRVWDRTTGELLIFIDRKGFFSAQGKSPSSSAPHLENDSEEMVLSDYESGSPPSQGEGAKIASLYDLAMTPGLNHRKGSFQTSEADAELSYQKGDLYHQKKDHHLQNGGYPFSGHGYVSNPMLWSMPDLRPSINTNFGASRSRNLPTESQQNNANLKQQGYDFGLHYRGLYEEHCKSAFEEDDGEMEDDEAGESEGPPQCVMNQPRNSLLHRRSLAMKVPQREQGLSPEGLSLRNIKSCDMKMMNSGRARMIHNSLPSAHEHGYWIIDKSPPNKSPLQSNVDTGTMSQNNSLDKLKFSSATHPVWCIDFRDNLIALGCANGQLEVWDGSTGKFKCLFEDGTGVGITSVKIIGNRVVAAKLSGSIDFFELESYRKGKQMDWSFNSYHRRTHVRTGSAGSLDWDSMLQSDEDIRVVRLGSVRAHQQPITVLDSEGGRILTGSQDHTLKVFRLEDHLQMYTLHGHCGPITALFIDKMCPLLSGSGSQDGMLCVWDLVTGACMYSIQAHDGSICALSYSASYVISLGTDERLCVWERFQGHLLNTIHVSHTYCSSMVMLTHNLLITSKQGSLVVWDVRTGDPVRIVRLGNNDSCVFVKQILLLRDGGAGGWGGEALCDYGNQLRIVRFPMASTEKTD